MNLAAIDLNLLVALEALIDESNVTRAAARVGLSQPVMSRALARLRELLDDPILLRTRHGMVRTARARSLALPLRRILDQIRDTLEPRQPFDPQVATETFTFTIPDAGQLMLIPALLGRLKQEAPLTKIKIRHQYPDQAQYEALESGEIDLGIELSRPLPFGFHAQHLFDVYYICIARTGHPAIGKRLTLKKFLELGHIGLGTHLPSTETDIDEILSRRSAVRRVVLTVPYYLPVPWLVAYSDLIATVPNLVVHVIGDRLPITCHKVPMPTKTLPVSIVWHERTHHEPKYQWLRNIIAQLFREAAEAARHSA